MRALLLAALLLAPSLAAAADLVEIRRVMPPGEPGTTSLVLNRDAVTAIAVEQQKGTAVTIEVTLDPQAKQRFAIRCIDIGSARMVVDVLAARGGAALVDVSGRCTF
ncbi:MAG: hypothetical protein U1E14_16830 [Geminicoccaceae bacterium]